MAVLMHMLLDLITVVLFFQLLRNAPIKLTELRERWRWNCSGLWGVIEGTITSLLLGAITMGIWDWLLDGCFHFFQFFSQHHLRRVLLNSHLSVLFFLTLWLRGESEDAKILDNNNKILLVLKKERNKNGVCFWCASVRWDVWESAHLLWLGFCCLGLLGILTELENCEKGVVCETVRSLAVKLLRLLVLFGFWRAQVRQSMLKDSILKGK